MLVCVLSCIKSAVILSTYIYIICLSICPEYLGDGDTDWHDARSIVRAQSLPFWRRYL